MQVERIADGLWRWTALHPDWNAEADWEEEVACHYVEAEGDVVLVDPLVPADEADREAFFEALDRDLDRAGPPQIVLTVFWHERSARELAGRYAGASVWANRKALDRVEAPVTHPFSVGDPLPGGLQAFEADRRDEVIFWIPAHRALVAGDVLLGDDAGGLRLCPDSWLPEGVNPADFRAGLRPLLDLPFERILLGHGLPVLEDAHGKLERALA
jgi:glyoxylase-like metal-dependent hydrolase (beta-lactamase superfamily II)